MQISEPIKKLDHDSKARGEALYIADVVTQGRIYGKLLRASVAKAKITAVHLPELPEGYTVVDCRDVPGRNRVPIVQDDIPVFADGGVEYVGEPILMVTGPCQAELKRLIAGAEVEYEALPPVLDVEQATEVFYDLAFEKGDVQKAFAAADTIREEKFSTGRQEHAYLETQGIQAEYKEGRMLLRGSMQCPYYIHAAVSAVLGCQPEDIQVVQAETGGAFGGKEDFPSILAAQAAVAAYKTGKPVQVVFDRDEDMEATSKRHPAYFTYRAAVKDGRITGMEIDCVIDAGAYTTLSLVVLQRTMISACGVYTIPNLRVTGKAVKSNTVPNGAFRGFGDPQSFFAVEVFMNHLAQALGQESLAFKSSHFAKQGDETATCGQYHFPVPLPSMVNQVVQKSDYIEKRRAYARQAGRYRKGIGIAMHYHGVGFATTKDVADDVKVWLRKTPDDQVEVLTANTDMGQGLQTTFTKIVARALQLPMDRVVVRKPDTDRVPNSGPTVASRSLMTVGGLLDKAARRLKENWEPGKEQHIEERFVQPDYIIPYDPQTFKGDAYPDFAWGVCSVELELDTLTGVVSLLEVNGCFDLGTPIDREIVIGQMEGGVLQGIGYASMEQMPVDGKGRIRNNTFSDYIIPTSLDLCRLHCDLYEQPYPYGPFGAKGGGELPNGGPAGAYIQALEQALGGVEIRQIPFPAEQAKSMAKEAALYG